MSKRKLSRLVLLGIAALAFALLVAACGGGGSTSEATSAETTAEAEAEPEESEGGSEEPASEESGEGEVPEATTQKTLDKAMGAHVPLSEMPPTIVHAFEHASMELSEEQLNTALKCWE